MPKLSAWALIYRQGERHTVRQVGGARDASRDRQRVRSRGSTGISVASPAHPASPTPA